MNFLKKLTALLLIAVMLIPLSACNASGTTVFEYNGEKLTSGVFSYILSENKSYFLAMYGYQDSAEFWNIKMDDETTLGEGYMENIIDYAKNLVVTKALAKEYGITISDENKASVKKMVDECIASYGGRAKWGLYLAKFGVTIEEFTQYMEDCYLMDQVSTYVSSENGPSPIDEENLFEQFKNETSYVEHILINLEFKYKNDNGETVTMTDDEKKAKLEELNGVAEKLSSGEEKWDDWKTKNEDNGSTYFVTETSSFLEEFKKAALEMKVGEIRVVQTSAGFHIMRRLEITEKIYEESDEGEKVYVPQKKAENYQKLMDSKKPDIIVNEEELSKFSIISAPVLD